MKTIYFVRHGESEANAAGIAAGSGLDVSLSEHGKMQAQRVGEVLKNKKIDLIVSSPMKRAHETAEIVAQKIGYDKSKIITNELFIERYLGSLTGVKKERIKINYDAGMLPADAETTELMHARMVQGLEWLKSLPQQRIVLVSHGGPGRMVRAIYRQEHHNQINELDRIGNAEIMELSL